MPRYYLHVGDVMVQGSDLLGDRVNIAARLENLAEPRSVYISDATHMYVRRSPALSFDDLGIQEIKNMDEPIRVYRVVAPALAPLASALPAKVLPFPDKPSICCPTLHEYER